MSRVGIRRRGAGELALVAQLGRDPGHLPEAYDAAALGRHRDGAGAHAEQAEHEPERDEHRDDAHRGRSVPDGGPA